MTERCIRCLVGYAPGVHVLLVDNGSGPGEWDWLTRTFAGFASVELTQTGSNLGYAGGMQWGIRTALEQDAQFVWLVNNDCEVSPGSLEPLLREMEEHPDTAACSGIIEYPCDAGTCFNAGSRPDIVRGRVVPLAISRSAVLGLPERYEVGFVPGHAWLLRAPVIREIGGLDCRLFLMGEEPGLVPPCRGSGVSLSCDIQGSGESAGRCNVAKIRVRIPVLLYEELDLERPSTRDQAASHSAP